MRFLGRSLLATQALPDKELNADCHAFAGLDFLFHMFFLIKYSKALEEGSFRGKSADFFWMLLFGKSQQCSCWAFVKGEVPRGTRRPK